LVKGAVRRAAAIGTVGVAIAGVLAGTGPQPVIAQVGGVYVFVPVTLRRARASDFARVSPAPTRDPRTTDTPVPTGTVVIPPTRTPRASATPRPTDPAAPAGIHGRITVDGEPMSVGMGVPGGPQIELRKCAAGQTCDGDQWQAVDHTAVTGDGRFEFHNPSPLQEGERYQVWWVNDFDHVDSATSEFLGRWWSRPIQRLDEGDVVDVGTFEVGDLKLKEICHDCLQTPPITFKWATRRVGGESYQWSLFRGCGAYERRYGAWRTKSLGHKGEYTTGPPPGFKLDERYCWYVFIDDGVNGTGWSFDDWRVTFMSQ
jgi:hypothetical protein